MLIEFLTVGTERNSERPLAAVELLSEAKRTIERLYNGQGMREGKQLFMVKAIMVDLRHGLVDIVIDDNK